ncbi:hypothetical protein MXB_1857, partial [Myxobolus squamalis]
MRHIMAGDCQNKQKIICVLTLDTNVFFDIFHQKTYNVTLKSRSTKDNSSVFGVIQRVSVNPLNPPELIFGKVFTASMHLCCILNETNKCLDECNFKDELFPENRAVKYFLRISFDQKFSNDALSIEIETHSQTIFSLILSHVENQNIVLPFFSNLPITIRCGTVKFEIWHSFQDFKEYIKLCHDSAFSFVLIKAFDSLNYLQISAIICIRANEDSRSCDLGVYPLRFSPTMLSTYSCPIQLQFPPNGKIIIDLIIRKYNSNGKFYGNTLIQRRIISELFIRISSHFEMCH